MKMTKYIYLLFAVSLVMGSCKKDFLVRNPPTAVPIAKAIVTEKDLADAVNGMYESMALFSSYGANTFARDIPVLGDLLADNVYVSRANSGRYLSENNYSFISTNGEAADIYSRGYYTILQTNRIITASVKPSDNVSQLKGEAYIVRALNYLELVNFFGQPYTVAPDDPGVPIILTPTDPNNPYITPARAKVSAVYTQIISDLDSAYLIMPDAGTTLHAINSEYLARYAAKAIEARAYLYKGDYANAKKAALLVVQNGGYSLTPADNLLAYWANPAPQANKTETIFELAETSTINNGTDQLAAIYSQSGYGDLLVTPDLYNSYSSTDVRKQLILTGKRAGNKALINNKYSNLLNTTDQDDIKVIRYAEVLLTLAESYAQTADDADALTYVNQVAKIRDPGFKGYKSSDQTLINDIVNERRKELAFEGLRFFDLTRLNLDIVRPQLESSAPSIGEVPVGSNKRILPIPQAEIDANPGTTQNPGYLGN
jgi:hypothetical protein